MHVYNTTYHCWSCYRKPCTRNRHHTVCLPKGRLGRAENACHLSSVCVCVCVCVVGWGGGGGADEPRLTAGSSLRDSTLYSQATPSCTPIVSCALRAVSEFPEYTELPVRMTQDHVSCHIVAVVNYLSH